MGSSVSLWEAVYRCGKQRIAVKSRGSLISVESKGSIRETECLSEKQSVSLGSQIFLQKVEYIYLRETEDMCGREKYCSFVGSKEFYGKQSTCGMQRISVGNGVYLWKAEHRTEEQRISHLCGQTRIVVISVSLRKQSTVSLWELEDLCGKQWFSVGSKVSLWEAEDLYGKQRFSVGIRVSVGGRVSSSDHFERHFSIHNKGYSLSSTSFNIRKTLECLLAV